MVVLYRKYRPEKWSEVKGQDHIVDILKEAVNSERIGHAYLFSGTRGTGKTTVARILASSLGIHDEDVYEIDAASNRGIDDIRELREHVSVLPFSSKFKVYIIDEVHMLSRDAWNALLKTLEEPPSHVVFVLATTELEKVPETIISRCQTFTFKKPAREILRKQIMTVAKEEGYELDAGAGDLIALLGDGSFRDALGTLEKVIASSPDKKLSKKEVEDITGSPQSVLVNDFISAVLAKDGDKALSVISKIDEFGKSMSTFSTLIIEKMRFILLASYSPATLNEIKDRLSEDDFAFITKESQSKNLTSEILNTFLTASESISRAKIESLPLELAVVGVCG